MANKHFTITASAESAITAAETLRKSFAQLSRNIARVNRSATGLDKVVDRLQRIGKAAGTAGNSVGRMSERIVASSYRATSSLGLVERRLDSISAKMLALRTSGMVNVSLGGGGGGGGGYGGGGGPSSYRERPLFGRFGGHLEQGQAVQNAIMAMLPLLIPAVLGIVGIKSAIDSRVQGIVFNNALDRVGASDQARRLASEAMRSSSFSGGSRDANLKMGAELALGGHSGDGFRSLLELAKDVGAAGGDSFAFLKALREDGPTMANNLHDIAKGLGLQLDETLSVNEVLRELQSSIGGLSAEVEKAKEGWPEVGRLLYENLGFLAEAIGLSGGASAEESLPNKLADLMTGDADGSRTDAALSTGALLSGLLVGAGAGALVGGPVGAVIGGVAGLIGANKLDNAYERAAKYAAAVDVSGDSMRDHRNFARIREAHQQGLLNREQAISMMRQYRTSAREGVEEVNRYLDQVFPQETPVARVSDSRGGDRPEGRPGIQGPYSFSGTRGELRIGVYPIGGAPTQFRMN